MQKVLIAPMTLAGVDGPHLRILREAGFDVVFPPKPLQLTEPELTEQLQGITAVLAGSEPYTARVLAAHPQLRHIARVGVGYDAVDCQAATEHGVAVTIAPNTNQEAVAEHTFALMLALAKDLVPQHLAVKQVLWPRRTHLPLRGRTLGIIGLGRIGKAVANLGKAFGMKLIAYEPYVDQAFVQNLGITILSLDQVFAEADYLTLHIPLTPESKHLINKRTLSLMKKTAYLINTARGGLVCEADLVPALKNRQIAGAGLDVFEEEPPGPNALFALENVVLTPHIAGMDLQSRDDMAASAAEAVVSLSRGQWPAEKVVNPEVRERFRW